MTQPPLQDRSLLILYTNAAALRRTESLKASLYIAFNVNMYCWYSLIYLYVMTQSRIVLQSGPAPSVILDLQPGGDHFGPNALDQSVCEVSIHSFLLSNSRPVIL